MPLWIGQCIETHRQHWADVRLVGREQWCELWKDDRDLENAMETLCVANKSDVIRACLISHYGGLWIDADCIVFRNLRPLMMLLEKYEFFCSAQFDRNLSAGFVGSRPGGTIAAAWYARQKEVLRQQRPIQWLTLGSDAMTQAIKKSQKPYFLIHANVISPIGWNKYKAFFKRASDDEHVPRLVPEAFCYMMFNKMISEDKASESMTAPDSFYSFLLRCSRQNVGASPIGVKGTEQRARF